MTKFKFLSICLDLAIKFSPLEQQRQWLPSPRQNSRWPITPYHHPANIKQYKPHFQPRLQYVRHAVKSIFMCLCISLLSFVDFLCRSITCIQAGQFRGTNGTSLFLFSVESLLILGPHKCSTCNTIKKCNEFFKHQSPALSLVKWRCVGPHKLTGHIIVWSQYYCRAHYFWSICK